MVLCIGTEKEKNRIRLRQNSEDQVETQEKPSIVGLETGELD